MAEKSKKKDDQGSVQEFLHLHSKYQHRIYGFIMSFVADWNIADDIYQETLSVLWKKYSEFVPGTNFLSWAFTIAHFQILSHQKKQKTLKKHFSQATLDNLNEVAFSSVNESDQTLVALRNCVKKLSDRGKKLIKLRYENELTVAKIAERIQQSVHTLYKEYQKIHRQLFQCVRKQIRWD